MSAQEPGTTPERPTPEEPMPPEPGTMPEQEPETAPEPPTMPEDPDADPSPLTACAPTAGALLELASSGCSKALADGLELSL